MVVKKSDTEKIKEAVSGEEEIKEVKNTDELKLTDLPGIGPAVAAKLESAGVFDLMSLAVMGRQNFLILQELVRLLREKQFRQRGKCWI